MATFIALSQHFKWKYLWSPSLWYSFVYSKFWFQLASKALILLPAFSMISSLFLNFPYWGSLRHNGKTIMVMESMKQTSLFSIKLWIVEIHCSKSFSGQFFYLFSSNKTWVYSRAFILKSTSLVERRYAS